MNNRQIGETFSKGDFETAYAHFADGIQWHIIGDQKIEGRENVISHCEKMLNSMDASTLSNTNVIEEGNSVAVEGFCHFRDEEGKSGEVNYCDIYRFEDGKIVHITSYCISFTN